MLSEKQISIPGTMALCRRCSIVLILGFGISLGKTSAQTSIEDVHVAPRSAVIADHLAVKTDKPSNGALFKTRVDLVTVPVSVTDTRNRIVLGLEKENFQIYENRREQLVYSCSSEDAPISIGIVLDTSGSMRDKLDQAREAIRLFLTDANPEDEFFMITFADDPIQLADMGSSSDQIQEELMYAAAKGSTALLDAVYLALAEMRHARYSRKALLIVSDGGDNHSHYREADIRRAAKEANVMIYAIGIYDRFFETLEERLGPELLTGLSTLTGGRAFVIEDPSDLADAARKIGLELRNVYMLTYTPKDSERDGKWHKIKVKLSVPKGLPRLDVHAREGYYASNEAPQ